MKWIKYLIINIVLLIFLLIMIDPLIPYFTSQENGDPPRSIRLQEHYLNRVSNIKFNNQNVKLRTNNQGYIIGPSYNEKNLEDILFLGSSTTECFLVDEDKRFPYYSVELINKELGTNYNSLNGAIGASNLYHIFLNLITKTSYPNVPPEYVFLTVGVSDFGYLDKIGNYLDGPRGTLINNTITTFSFIKQIKDVFFPNLYSASKKLFEFSIPNNIQGGVDNYTNFGNSFLKENEALLFDQWEKILDLIISYCKINNINLIIMTEHNIDSLKEKTDYAKMRINNRDKLNTFLRQKAILNNLQLIDLDILFEKNKFFYMEDMAHLNTEGSIEVSRIIFKEFINKIANEKN